MGSAVDEYSWGREDAWVLLAAASTSSGRLIDVIGTADAINHMIPHEHEIEVAVRKLSAAGLLDVRGEELVVTQHGEDLVARTEARDWQRQLARLGRRLERLTYQAARGQSLPDGAAGRALDAYERKYTPG